MVFLWIGIAAVVALLGAAGWIDFKARRTGRPLHGIDREAALDARRQAQAETEQRIRYQDFGGGGLF